LRHGRDVLIGLLIVMRRYTLLIASSWL